MNINIVRLTEVAKLLGDLLDDAYTKEKRLNRIFEILKEVCI